MIESGLMEFAGEHAVQDDSGLNWVLACSTGDGIEGGYAGQVMMLWKPDGRPLLRARQSIAIFG